jgi:hypothetical protein
MDGTLRRRPRAGLGSDARYRRNPSATLLVRSAEVPVGGRVGASCAHRLSSLWLLVHPAAAEGVGRPERVLAYWMRALIARRRLRPARWNSAHDVPPSASPHTLIPPTVRCTDPRGRLIRCTDMPPTVRVMTMAPAMRTGRRSGACCRGPRWDRCVRRGPVACASWRPSSRS